MNTPRPHDPPQPDVRDLFMAFLGIAISGFGGVLPFARRTLVERRRWLTAEDFNETLSLCQSLPGPNIVNVSVVVGARFAGPAGALAAVSGLVLAPMGIVIVMGAVYNRFGSVDRLQGAVTGLAAAAAGLVAATALKMAVPLVKRHPLWAGAVIAAAFAAVGLCGLPLLWVLAVLAPLSIGIAWRRA